MTLFWLAVFVACVGAVSYVVFAPRVRRQNDEQPPDDATSSPTYYSWSTQQGGGDGEDED